MKTHVTIVLLLITFALKAQTVSSITKDQLANAMALFVEKVKPSYQKGQNYKDFEKALLGTWSNTTEGTALLSKAFDYLCIGSTSDQIIKNYNGPEMTNALLVIANSKSDSNDGITIFGGVVQDSNSFNDKATKQDCKWYQILCFVQKVTVN